MRPDPSPSNRLISRPTCILLMIFGLHAYQSLRLFPSWDALTDDRPVVMVDHAIHLYHGALGAEFFQKHATSWGYDPFFMAGYPETPVWDSSSNLAIAFELAGGGSYNPRAYKIGLFVLTVLIVPFLAFGVRAAGLSTGEAATTSALAFVVFGAFVPTVLWRSGLFAFVTASTFLVPMLGLLVCYDRRPTPVRWGALVAGGSVFVFTHVTAPILLFGGAIGYLLATMRDWRGRRKRFGGVLLAAGIALGLNGFWLVPLLRFRTIRDAGFFFMNPGSIRAFPDLLLNNPLDGRVLVVLLALGVAGLVAWRLQGRRLLATLFGFTAAFFVALCWLGGLSTFTMTLEPLRFITSLEILLTVPAGSAVWRIMRKLAARTGGNFRGRVAFGALTLAVFVAMVTASPLTFLYAVKALARPRRLAVGLRPEDKGLVEWLRVNTDLSARIMFEDQLRLLEDTDPESTHWTPLLPLLLRPEARSFVGGIYQTAFIAHNRRANFGDYTLGGRRIDGWKADELTDYAREYNVGWAVAWSPLSRYVLDRFSLAKKVATLPRATSPELRAILDDVQWKAIADKAGDRVANFYLNEGVASYALYRLERPHSYFLTGKGQVTGMALNRIELADVEPEPGSNSVILSMHWLDTWRSDPPLRLSPIQVSGDPIPFVEITLDKRTAKIVLDNRY